jgi:hypothetical protein
LRGPQTLHELVFEACDRYPLDAVAVEEAETGRHVTYGQLQGEDAWDAPKQVREMRARRTRKRGGSDHPAVD